MVHKTDPKLGPLIQRLGPSNGFKTGSANAARKPTKNQKCACAFCVSRSGRAGQSQSSVPGARARPVRAGFPTMLCGVVGGGLSWRSLFLQRLSRPMFGAIMRTYFGTCGFHGPLCEPIFGTMVLGSLIQGHRIMNTRPSFWSIKRTQNWVR